MESRWLEDFLSLVDTRNFSRSAQARYTTQPAFSRRIVNRHAILTPYRHPILPPLGAAEIGARADGTDHGVQAGRASIGVRRGF